MFLVSFGILVFCRTLRENNSFKAKKMQSLEDLDDVVMFNQISERIKSEFL
jgi:hypothetical protein